MTLNVLSKPYGRQVSSLRHNGPCPQHSFIPDHCFRSVVIVLADVLEQLHTAGPVEVESALPRGRECPRVLDGHFVFQRIEVGSGNALDQVKAISVWDAIPVHPGTLVETDS